MATPEDISGAGINNPSKQSHYSVEMPAFRATGSDTEEIPAAAILPNVDTNPNTPTATQPATPIIDDTRPTVLSAAAKDDTEPAGRAALETTKTAHPRQGILQRLRNGSLDFVNEFAKSAQPRQIETAEAIVAAKQIFARVLGNKISIKWPTVQARRRFSEYEKSLIGNIIKLETEACSKHSVSIGLSSIKPEITRKDQNTLVAEEWYVRNETKSHLGTFYGLYLIAADDTGENMNEICAQNISNARPTDHKSLNNSLISADEKIRTAAHREYPGCSAAGILMCLPITQEQKADTKNLYVYAFRLGDAAIDKVSKAQFSAVLNRDVVFGYGDTYLNARTLLSGIGRSSDYGPLFNPKKPEQFVLPVMSVFPGDRFYIYTNGISFSVKPSLSPYNSAPYEDQRSLYEMLGKLSPYQAAQLLNRYGCQNWTALYAVEKSNQPQSSVIVVEIPGQDTQFSQELLEMLAK